MKTLRNFTRQHRVLTVGLLLMFTTLAAYSFAQYYVSATAEQRATDRYYYLMENHRVADLQALIDCFAEQQFTFMGVALPGTEPWDQSAGVYPVDWAAFPEELTKQLVGYWEGEVPVYDLYVYQDEQTREIVILNSDEKEIYSIECPYLDYCDPATYALERRPDLYSYSKEDFDYYIAHYDLARVGLHLTLVPTENLYDYLYAEAQNASFMQAMNASSLSAGGGGGGMAMMGSGGSNDMEVTAFQLISNRMEVTVAWPADWTNRIDMYSFDGGGYKGAGFGLWELADSGLVTLGTNQMQWIDTGQLGRGLPADEEVRFYAAGNADLDQDGDGFNSGYEHLVLNTDPDNGDTDGDGVSDGPFDPDNNGPIVAGPDPDPLNSNVVADTDGDGIDDATDTDDDNDGLPDSVETNGVDRLIPITIALFKTVSVQNVDPSGDDNGTEQFDVSSAGRALPYATGGNAAGGFGALRGGIYFNHDETNLYVAVAGFEKDGNNALMLLLDTDGTNGGAASLSGLSGNPPGFGEANNLSFNSASFTPNVGILVGERYADGHNDASSMGIGQGVYSLAPSAMGDFPGFTSTNGAISQWGDRGTNSANAGIEIELSLSSLGLGTGDVFKAAAIVAGGASGGNRFFSGEAYGQSVSGTLDPNNFGFNSVTLLGAPVYISGMFAPTYAEPPPVDGDDVILQGYTWDVPRPALSNYHAMTVAGNFNGWNAGLSNMTLVGDYTWEYIHTFTNDSGIEFKFVANGSFGSEDDWGDNNQADYVLPINNETGNLFGANIAISGTISGAVRFRNTTADPPTYNVETVSAETVTTLLPGRSAKFWYEDLRGKVESNELDNFTLVWMPPPQKCDSGINSVGYDPFDYFDLGTYDEKSTIPTLYGREEQLRDCVSAMKSRGIRAVMDLVLNHNQGGYSTEGGSGQYNFAFQNHDTFEKIDPAGNNSNQYYNANTVNEPFQYETGFGPDVNVGHPYQRLGLKNWGDWVTAKIGYEGYRWDIPYNIEPWFVSEFIGHGLKQGRFSVSEFWELEDQGTVGEMETFLALTDYRTAIFDMRLREEPKDLCELGGNEFDISTLAHAGLVSRQPQWSVPFVESHDTIRPYGDDGKLGIAKDKALAYVFAILSEGTPMVPISDYLISPKIDSDPDSSGWATNVVPMKEIIDSFIDIRRTYAGGTTAYLSTMNTNDLFIMKRNGNTTKPGCILVINDNDTTTLSDTNVVTGWVSTNLVDVIDTNHVVSTDASGIATLQATNRGYRVYVPQGDL